LEALNNELAGVREAMQRHYSVGEEALGLVVKVGDGFVGFNDTNIIYNFASTDVSEVLVSKTIERAEASHEASATNQTAGLVLPIPGMPGALDSQGGASSIKMS
jgi:hypothetical protein